jgi:CheY-specific phosphatase CheX
VLKGILVESTVQIQREEIEQVAGSVFTAMMGLEMREAPASIVPEDAETLTAMVFLTGAWQGAVLVQCDPEDARQFAGCFLGEPAPEEVTSDVRDVLGEIANMIAGNFKCTLRPGIRVSVPSVVSGTDYTVRLCGTKLAAQMLLENEKGSICLSVLELKDPV